ncbi:molybdate ABC transporter permease subunit [Teredinibacter purpureus]|jgi:molybdate ABC transporter, permease protein|uniref:molybdate ABC transporter permease subunit n=1 Tax=Teredinibacter purpureus TaxID=2731756 RepID=UPI0005F7A40D|nr:molybdate ABC transporter permease subunit [Teredinibacter purpureus]
MLSLDYTPILLTLKLAITTTWVLLFIALPLSWWLARTAHPAKPYIATLVAMPLVLPPTVLGFYLLLLLGPEGFVGQMTQALGIGTLPFTFSGLVVASVIYSLPFAVQPLENAFRLMGTQPLETAATLRASPIDRFFTIALPLARPGLLTAIVLSFAHTMGEFGVVLMIGGNIPGETQVLSMAIYNHVESQEYTQAHWLAAGMLIFAFSVLFSVQLLERKQRGLNL